MAKLEFDHAKDIESITAQAHLNAITAKDKASMDIYDIQNNLLLTESQKAENIKKAADDYITNKRKIEADTYTAINIQNSIVQANLDAIQKSVEAQRKTAMDNAKSSIASGAFYSMSPDEQAATAKATGKSVSELVRTADSAISSNVSAALQGMLGKSYAVPSDKYAAMIASVKNKLKLGGYSLDRAITEAVNEYVSTDATAKAAAARMTAKETYTPIDSPGSSTSTPHLRYQKNADETTTIFDEDTKKVIGKLDEDGNMIGA